MHDAATFIFEAASHLARTRQAVQRGDPAALRAAVLALRDASEAAGAAEMIGLCARLRDLVAGGDAAELDALLDRIADEFEKVASVL